MPGWLAPQQQQQQQQQNQKKGHREDLYFVLRERVPRSTFALVCLRCVTPTAATPHVRALPRTHRNKIKTFPRIGRIKSFRYHRISYQARQPNTNTQPHRGLTVYVSVFLSDSFLFLFIPLSKLTVNGTLIRCAFSCTGGVFTEGWCVTCMLSPANQRCESPPFLCGPLFLLRCTYQSPLH